ncbi:MAG: pirin family protein [Myxococcota bacterium]
MIVESVPLGFPWPTLDPFLFCAYHLDEYPAGTDAMGPDPALLAGRSIGSDFTVKDGWRMYHGDVVPGFPRHPHRGFETVTVARKGLLDHADSLGATARFGRGDCQWMTAGSGIVHSEMFPLIDRDGPNTAELFQLWLNLPAKHKMVDPAFTMMWAATIPKVMIRDDAGRETVVTVNAGSLEGHDAPTPPPNSWAADPEHHVAVWTLDMQPGARAILPPTSAEAHRMLYFFRGQQVAVGEDRLDVNHAALVQADAPLVLENKGDAPAELLLLQGKPIGEPVANHGPFVMNTRAELQQAFADYSRTQFGGWPWENDGPAHPREQGRFAIHADGRREDAPVEG